MLEVVVEQQELMETQDQAEMVVEVMVVVIPHKLQLQLELQIQVVEVVEVLEIHHKKELLEEVEW